MKAQPVASVGRVALTFEEAAASLGVSLSHFRRHVAPGLRVIRSGSVRLVPVGELERWADRQASVAGDGAG
jgi:excisionase family DNA binding protein